MRAGKLNKQVVIERAVTVNNTDGGTTEKWEPVAKKVWAAIEPLRGREFFDAGGSQSEIDTRIRIRYRKGINPDMSVVYKKTRFDIQNVIDLRTDRRELHLMCKDYGDNSA